MQGSIIEGRFTRQRGNQKIDEATAIQRCARQGRAILGDALWNLVLGLATMCFKREGGLGKISQ
jgi:hypothetical protein